MSPLRGLKAHEVHAPGVNARLLGRPRARPARPASLVRGPSSAGLYVRRSHARRLGLPPDA